MMISQWRRNRALSRIEPGSGRALKPYRWYHQLRRSLSSIRIAGADGRESVYSVDVRLGGDKVDGVVRADLYKDGEHHARSKIPAVFPVEGGEIEVHASQFGLKRCHYVDAEGGEHRLVPDPKSSEGRRARFANEHPGASRFIGAVSVIALVAGVTLLALEIAESLAGIPPVVERWGAFEPPVDLPLWVKIAIGALAAVASTERALRLRYHWLLDGAAN